MAVVIVIVVVVFCIACSKSLGVHKFVGIPEALNQIISLRNSHQADAVLFNVTCLYS